MHIHHLTLTTGHSRRSHRDEITPETMRAAGDLLTRGIEAGRLELDMIQPAGHWLRITSTPDRRCLLATVSHGDELPLVTFGVALRPRCGAALWRGLLDCDPLIYGPMQGDPDAQPQTPWCAARIEPGLVYMPDAGAWLGDLERCIAWAWLDLHAPPRHVYGHDPDPGF
jgi:hypothetical protein